jgi:uncharacterized protein (DUF885 family)
MICRFVFTLICFSTAVQAQDSEVLPADPSLGVMRGLLQRYETDQRALERSYSTPLSDAKVKRDLQFLKQWMYELDRVDFDRLRQDEKIDYLLLRNQIRHEVETLKREADRVTESAELVPFRNLIVKLAEDRRAMKPIEPKKSAEQLVELSKQLVAAQTKVRAGDIKASSILANRTTRQLNELRRTLAGWHGFYDGYNPLFSWWTKKPYANAISELADYTSLVRTKFVGGDDDAVIGDPIGREALLTELQYEMIPYTPEELIEIANREFDWCEREMKRAATDLGFDGDWHKALDHVKGLHVEPGEQPQMIREQALEAIAFLKKNDLVTVPRLCEEVWRMSMLSPERQKTSPYFLGGETIQVAFPTDTMDHSAKLMSLRGNNRHFARATVHHELIPGHHLQGFMSRRYREHRRQFRTPFLIEGWALHWEMLLWEMDFQQSPEDRVGMLFWRSHRCARIIFSLNFHLKKMDAQECIEFLIKRVGHERNNATAEVRRSVSGAYGPLYQAAYMLGGLQMRSLHKQLVGSGKMTNREFHDAVLLENSIPLELIRANLLGTKLTSDHKASWRFYDLDPK